MNVLTFDIASGGISAAVFNEDLVPRGLTKIPWHIPEGSDGSAVLEVPHLEEALSQAFAAFSGFTAIDALSFSAFMHNCTLLDAQDTPITPIFTWMDRRGSEGIEYIRREFGESFHMRTGCRFHPMFPVFKIAWLRAANDPRLVLVRRIASAKSLITAWLCGKWAEDHGTASATGLYDVNRACWDEDLMRIVGLNRSMLPQLVEPRAIVGTTTPGSQLRYGVVSGIPVVAGSGDGFLANIGSGCGTSDRMAVTLGTSASVRQMLPTPVLDEAAGAFCYRADLQSFLFGCAGSNGGNVLDWARSVFGELPRSSMLVPDVPVFLPLLHGERSPDWNSRLKGSWHGITAHHTAEHLACAVVEGVAFNLAHYVDILQRASGQRAAQLILSGNGFLNPLAAETLAAVVDAEVRLPEKQGLASLRGAAICAFRALGIDASAAMEQLVAEARTISKKADPVVRERLQLYRQLRVKVTVR